MRHPLVCGLAALAFALPASAGLNIEAPASYAPGDLVTLTLTGDSEGAIAPIARALLTVDPSLSLVSSAAGTLNDSSEIFYWIPTGVIGTCGGHVAANPCVAVDAFADIFGEFALDLLPSTLSTFTFDTTDATGDILFSLDPDGAGFFGLPGTTLTIVPEPGTAVLLGLGMVALGHRWRLSEVVRGMQRSAPVGGSR